MKPDDATCPRRGAPGCVRPSQQQQAQPSLLGVGPRRSTSTGKAMQCKSVNVEANAKASKKNRGKVGKGKQDN